MGKITQKICLAASGGGHLRQLLDMQPVWDDLDHFIVTEDSALSRGLERQHNVYYLPHFAFGQSRLGKPVKMVAAAIASLIKSIAIIWRERPSILITTGAGSVFFTVVMARALGAKVIVIESFARFESPSRFSRMAMRFAHVRVVQSAKLVHIWKDAKLFDPLRILDHQQTRKENLVFGTVGATLPFDRLTDMLAVLKAEGRLHSNLVLQVGKEGLMPENIEAYETLPLDVVQSFLERADVVVCHGGTGSLITALRQGCKVIAVPRRFGRGEHYDDHQYEITRAFEARGIIDVAETPAELEAALARTASRPRVFATTDTKALNAFLVDKIAGWSFRGAQAAEL